MENTKGQDASVQLFGIQLSRRTMDETVALLMQAIQQRRTTHVITANPIMLMTGFEDLSFYSMLQQADLVVPDGDGIVWAAAHLKKPVAERVAGYDLVQRLFHVGSSRAWRVYLLGSTREVIETAAERVKSKYPGLQIVGTHHGYFQSSEDQRILQEIKESAADLLLVGRSTYTQDPWIAQYKHMLNVPVMIGVGGSFDVMAGKLKRAPIWMQRYKLEWLYRLIQEPKRFRRMLVLPKFVFHVLINGENVRRH